MPPETANETGSKIVPLPLPGGSGISALGRWKAFYGLLWCEWYAHSKLLVLFLAAWLASVWALPLYANPAYILMLGALFAIIAGPVFGGSDTLNGCEEFTFALPPTRAERYMARLTVGGGALLLLTAIDMLALGLDLPQILAKLYVGSGLIRPWPVFRSGLLYGLVLVLPASIFSISFVISAITRSRAVILSASLWAILVSLGILRLGFWHWEGNGLWKLQRLLFVPLAGRAGPGCALGNWLPGLSAQRSGSRGGASGHPGAMVVMDGFVRRRTGAGPDPQCFPGPALSAHVRLNPRPTLRLRLSMILQARSWANSRYAYQPLFCVLFKSVQIAFGFQPDDCKSRFLLAVYNSRILSQGRCNPKTRLRKTKHNWVQFAKLLSQLSKFGQAQVHHLFDGIRHHSEPQELNLKFPSARIAATEGFKIGKFLGYFHCQPFGKLIEDSLFGVRRIQTHYHF